MVQKELVFDPSEESADGLALTKKEAKWLRLALAGVASTKKRREQQRDAYPSLCVGWGIKLYSPAGKHERNLVTCDSLRLHAIPLEGVEPGQAYKIDESGQVAAVDVRYDLPDLETIWRNLLDRVVEWQPWDERLFPIKKKSTVAYERDMLTYYAHVDAGDLGHHYAWLGLSKKESLGVLKKHLGVEPKDIHAYKAHLLHSTVMDKSPLNSPVYGVTKGTSVPLAFVDEDGRKALLCSYKF